MHLHVFIFILFFRTCFIILFIIFLRKYATSKATGIFFYIFLYLTIIQKTILSDTIHCNITEFTMYFETGKWLQQTGTLYIVHVQCCR